MVTASESKRCIKNDCYLRCLLSTIAIYAVYCLLRCLYKCLLFCYIHIKNMSTGILSDKTSLTDNKTN